MNVSSSFFLSLRWLLLGLAGWASSAFAFPPAPTFTVHGIARDSYGWALKAVDQGVVVIKRNGMVIAEAEVNEALRAGENFRVLVPMDTNASDPYRAGALAAGVTFTLVVRFPTQTLLVSSLTATQRTIGQPAGMLFLDFTVGQDSDGDGIPDAWEWWQLTEFGVSTADPRWSLATLGRGDFDNDGSSDYIEYLAGTFAFLTEESLNLRISGFHTDGSAILRTLVVVDKTYRVESSTDLKTWTAVSVRPDLPLSAPLTLFTAANTYEVTLYSAASINQPALFYRLVLVR